MSSKRILISEAIALVHLRLRIRFRTLKKIFVNPMALPIAGLGTVAYLGIILTGNDTLSLLRPSSPALDAGGFIFFLFLMLVVVTGQRGSPLRWSAADISWVLQTPHGPRLLVLGQCIANAFIAAIGSSFAAAFALALRGLNPAHGLNTGFSVAALILLIRSVSLGAHLLGTVGGKLVRRCLVVGALVASALGTLEKIFNTGFQLFPGPWYRKYFNQIVKPIFLPEAGAPSYALATIAITGLVITLITVHAGKLVGSGVLEGIATGQLSRALSERKTGSLQGEGYRTGLSSWAHWPSSPLRSLFGSHIAQHRRQVRTYCGSVLLYLALVGVSFLFRDSLPMAWSLGVMALALAVSAPAQPAAAELGHQHLRLSKASPIRATCLGALVNAALDGLIGLPAMALWASLLYHSAGSALLLSALWLTYCLMVAFAGVASHVFSPILLGQVVVSAGFSIFPFLAALLSLGVYEQLGSLGSVGVTVVGTSLCATVLYFGLSCAAASAYES